MRSIRRGRPMARRSTSSATTKSPGARATCGRSRSASRRQPTKILSEETSWSARPELAPDGKRLLFGSYHGRQWQQLWLTTPAGVAPLPLTFGEFDRRNARWSPDGRRIAYIDNKDGNTALRVMDAIGGATRTVAAKTFRYKVPRARVLLDIVDEHGRRTPARVAVLGSDGRAHAPAGAWMHGDDGFDRGAQASETHYFHCAPPCTLDVPVGSTKLTVQHGFAYAPWQQQLDVVAGREARVQARLEPRRAAGRVRRLDQRRPARAHELRRPLPQHARPSGEAGARRGPGSRLQPDRQQGRTHPGHRPFPRRCRPGQHGAGHDPARAGIPHQFLGPSRPAASGRSLPDAGFLGVSPHRARQPLSA